MRQLPAIDCFLTSPLRVVACVKPLRGEQEQPPILINAERLLHRLLLQLSHLLTRSFLHFASTPLYGFLIKAKEQLR